MAAEEPERKVLPSKEAGVVEEENLTLYYVKVDVIGAKDLRNADLVGKSDPFCEVIVNQLQRTTPVIDDNLNPVWNCQYAFFVQECPSVISFKLWDEDEHSKNDLLGDSELKLGPLWESKSAAGSSWEGSLPVIYKGKQKGTLQCKAFVRVMQPVKTEKKLQKNCGSVGGYIKGFRSESRRI
jgi:Ca2+-dependent lipid-binding protein